jgi:hypothetical protein
MPVTVAGEHLLREDVVERLCLLQAKDVRLFLADELLDNLDPRPNRVDVPGSDFDVFAHDGALA